MKSDIHPDYVETHVTCSCGNTFTTRSIKSEMHVELCNQCHPFYTGKQKLVDTGGRVERFQKKYAASKARAEAVAASRPSTDAPAGGTEVPAPEAADTTETADRK